MRVSFVGRVASNHTAFIRIKASQPAPIQELLILPVEVEVTSGTTLSMSSQNIDENLGFFYIYIDECGGRVYLGIKCSMLW